MTTRHTATATAVMPSIRRRARRAAPTPARVPGLPGGTSRTLPYLATVLLVCAVLYALVVSGVRCGAAAGSHAVAASPPAPADAGADDATPDAAARADWAAGLGLGGPRPEQAPAARARPAPAASDNAAGDGNASDSTAGDHAAPTTRAAASRRTKAAPASKPKRFALSAFARSRARKRHAPPPPSTVLCDVPPNAILVLELTASVSTHLGLFETYRAHHHPCGHSFDLYLERTDRIVINALSLGGSPVCMTNLAETAIEIEERYALWIFPNGGVLTPCSSPHALSTRSRDQRTPRQGSFASRAVPASSTPAADGSRSPTTSGDWSDVFGSAPRSTRRKAP